MNKQGKSVLVMAMVMAFITMGLSLPVLGVSMVGSVAAQNCEGDFDYDGDVDGTDLSVFAEDFGRTDCPPKALAPVEKTGQTTSYATGDDGDLQKGMAWPIPRFTDNGDFTVTDRLTGLIWMKHANCFGERLWADAVTGCNALSDGSCGLSDGSAAGDWRLPNIKELYSLVHYGVDDPALPNTQGTGKWAEWDPFIGVQSGAYYWSSTTRANITNIAWNVEFRIGFVILNGKDALRLVWCVRGGQ
jgi:hypothetical protein